MVLGEKPAERLFSFSARLEQGKMHKNAGKNS